MLNQNLTEEFLTDVYNVHLEWLSSQDAERAKESNFMQEAKFTPLYWAVAEQDERVSNEVLTVLGRILGYCQMKDGSCSASLKTIAKEVRLSLSTVKRSVKVLENRDYIWDTTPTRLKAPHVYIPTNKLMGILRKAGIKMKNIDG